MLNIVQCCRSRLAIPPCQFCSTNQTLKHHLRPAGGFPLSYSTSACSPACIQTAPFTHCIFKKFPVILSWSVWTRIASRCCFPFVFIVYLQACSPFLTPVGAAERWQLPRYSRSLTVQTQWSLDQTPRSD